MLDKKEPHRKKNKEDLKIGKYSAEDLDIWAELIQSGVCTYEGIASVYSVSVGALHNRLYSITHLTFSSYEFLVNFMEYNW